MKRIITSIAVLALATSAAIGGTIAFYNDTETSTDNIFTAGSLDLRVDHYFQSYNGSPCEGFCEEVGDNLVLNGGFEDPEVTHSADWQLFASGAPGLEWEVQWVGNTTLYDGLSRPDPALAEHHDGVLGNAHEGEQYTELDSDWDGPDGSTSGEPASVRISQEISTTPGTKYRVTFAFAPRPNTGSGENQLEFSWDGVVVDTLSDSAGGGSINWTTTSYDVIATGATTEIAFADRGTENSQGTFLDAVVVRELKCDYTLPGATSCELWEETDIDDETFFDFFDVKPGDLGRNGISLHVYDNNAWACLITHDVIDGENTIYEPESAAGDTSEDDGELDKYMEAFAWLDLDEDGLYDPADGETELAGPDSFFDIMTNISVHDATSDNGPLLATSTEYVGFAWCLGDLTVAEDGQLSCNGAGSHDDAQSDSLSASLTAYAVQQRNNASFDCSSVDLESDDEGPQDIEVTAEDLATTLEAVQSDPDAWFFYNDTNDTFMSLNEFAGTGGVNDIVVGPEGVGAAQMTLHSDPADPRYNIATAQFGDIALSDISGLSFRTYDDSASSQTPFLHFNVSFDGVDSWQGRLVYVPGASANPGMSVDTWTTVDAIAGGSGMWTWSGYAGNGNQWPDADTDQYRSWSDILAAFPSAETLNLYPWLGVRVGHPGPVGETGYVDWISFDGQVYDFN